MRNDHESTCSNWLKSYVRSGQTWLSNSLNWDKVSVISTLDLLPLTFINNLSFLSQHVITNYTAQSAYLEKSPPKQVPNTYAQHGVTQARWHFAAAFGLILCYFIVNPSSSLPTAATSTVHALTQSAWQLLQYWKVGSITLFAALIKRVAQRLLFEMLGKQMASLLFGRATCTADNGENTSGGNWDIAEINAKRFSGLDPHQYFLFLGLQRLQTVSQRLADLHCWVELHDLEEVTRYLFPHYHLTYSNTGVNARYATVDVWDATAEYHQAACPWWRDNIHQRNRPLNAAELWIVWDPNTVVLAPRHDPLNAYQLPVLPAHPGVVYYIHDAPEPGRYNRLSTFPSLLRLYLSSPGYCTYTCLHHLSIR